ncbi:MAG: DMT family transporter [Ruminococcaceae bacterium]|nr:DMT family transporter [Oscillospiraceae bacterium]
MKKSYMFAGISIFIWSTIATIAKLLLGTLSNFQVLFVSCFFAFMFLLIVNIITGDIKKLRGYRFKDFIITTFVGLPGTFLYQMFYYAGTARMPASQAFIVNYLWPIMGVVFAIIILREKLNLRKVIAIIMSFLGVVIVTCRDLAHFDKAIITGALFCVLGAISYGAFTALTQLTNYDKKISSMIYYFNTFLLTGIWILITKDYFTINLLSTIGLAYNGIFCLAVGTTCWALALENGKTAKIANLAYITPFLSLIWTAIFLKDKIRPEMILGLIVIVLGILIQLKKDKKE